jgi:cell division cycle 20-like protein 1 (cofactor of APC complex)
LQRDLRVNTPFINKLIGHKQEVCGLKWSPDEQQLCSGGNDNKLLVWNNHASEPILKYCDHLAAVKAVAWSPHQHGLLVFGGGTADRTIRFRNTLTGTTVKTMDANSLTTFRSVTCFVNEKLAKLSRMLGCIDDA